MIFYIVTFVFPRFRCYKKTMVYTGATYNLKDA